MLDVSTANCCVTECLVDCGLTVASLTCLVKSLNDIRSTTKVIRLLPLRHHVMSSMALPACQNLMLNFCGLFFCVVFMCSVLETA